MRSDRTSTVESSADAEERVLGADVEERVLGADVEDRVLGPMWKSESWGRDRRVLGRCGRPSPGADEARHVLAGHRQPSPGADVGDEALRVQGRCGKLRVCEDGRRGKQAGQGVMPGAISRSMPTANAEGPVP